MTLKCVPSGTLTALLTASSNNSRMVKITLMTVANHTRPTNSSASHTPLFLKLGCISKTAKPGTRNPTMKNHGPTSKCISNARNVFSETSFAQPNKLASNTAPSQQHPTTTRISRRPCEPRHLCRRRPRITHQTSNYHCQHQ